MEATTLERAAPSRLRPRRLDWTAPLSVGAVVLLAALVLLPMSWLAVTSLRDDARRFTLEDHRRLFIDPSFLTPPFRGAFAWVLLGGPNAGLLNQWYYALFGLKPFEATPLLNIFSAWGMV